MLSVIIPTRDSERALVSTLAVLVPAAMEGFIAEVLVADGGSRDDTAAVADVAGCKFSVVEGSLGRRLKTAAAGARAPWLFFLRPGTILDAAWIGEARRFVEEPSPVASAGGVPARRAGATGVARSAVASCRRARRPAAPRAGPDHRQTLLRGNRRPRRGRRRARGRSHPPDRPAADRPARQHRVDGGAAAARYLT